MCRGHFAACGADTVDGTRTHRGARKREEGGLSNQSDSATGKRRAGWAGDALTTAVVTSGTVTDWEESRAHTYTRARRHLLNRH